MLYPNSTELIRTFFASFRNSPNLTLLGTNVCAHFLYEDKEYYVYLKCVTYAGHPYPENVTRAQLPKRAEFDVIINSNSRFLFIGYDIYNQVFVCWDPNKAKSRLNKKNYVSFFSRKSVQDSVETGNIVSSSLTNGDVFVTFKKDDINVFFLTIENYFTFEGSKTKESLSNTTFNNSISLVEEARQDYGQEKVNGSLESIEDDVSVKLLIDELIESDSDKMTIIASCINNYGSFYPKMGFNAWKALIYQYLDKPQRIIEDESPLVVEKNIQDSSGEQIIEYHLQLRSKKITASAHFVDGCFTVLKGSEAIIHNGTSLVNPEKRDTTLSANAHIKGDVWVLDKDISFKSPSGASDFCLGVSSNGWREWVDENKTPLERIYNKNCSKKKNDETVNDNHEVLNTEANQARSNHENSSIFTQDAKPGKRKSHILRVSFPDGQVFEDNNVSNTYCEVIKRIGPEEVSILDIYHAGVNIVSRELDQKYSNYQRDIGHGWFVMTNSSTRLKFSDLQRIKDEYGIDMNIELVPIVQTAIPAVKKQDPTAYWYQLHLKTKILKATGLYFGDHFFVLKGSQVRVGIATSEKFMDVLASNSHKEGDFWVLDDDVIFNSPSTAATFCFGRNSNGWLAWVDDNNTPLKVIFDKNCSKEIESCIQESSSMLTIKQPNSQESTKDDELLGENVDKKHIKGLWTAYKSKQFRNRFEKHLIDCGEHKEQAKFKMLQFYYNVKDADASGYYSFRLNECKTFDELHTTLSELIERWKKYFKYSWLRDLFFDYLDFLKEIYRTEGSLDGIGANVKNRNYIYRGPTIELTYQDGKIEQLLPYEALKKVVLLIGPEKVAKMDLRITNFRLLVKHQPIDFKFYEKLNHDWWILNRGKRTEQYKVVYVILLYNKHLGIKAELL